MCNDVDAVVSFGDLIGCNEHVADNDHRGCNIATLTYTRLYSEYHDDWLQLIGPNEIAALNSPDTWTNRESTKFLRDSWLDSERFVTAGVWNESLLTHGGLTYGEWLSIGEPETAEEAAERLNSKYNGTLYQGECLRLGQKPRYFANPIWADPVLEVYPSWATAPVDCPFDQIHAESSLGTELGRRLLQDDFSPVSAIDGVRFNSYGSVAEIGDAELTAVELDIVGPLLTSLPTSRRIRVAKTED